MVIFDIFTLNAYHFQLFSQSGHHTSKKTAVVMLSKRSVFVHRGVHRRIDKSNRTSRRIDIEVIYSSFVS